MASVLPRPTTACSSTSNRASRIERKALLDKLIQCQYERNDVDFYRGRFRLRGENIDVFPAYEEEKAIRIVLDDDMVSAIYVIDPLTGKTIEKLTRCTIYPATHYVTPKETLDRAVISIEEELDPGLKELRGAGKLLEAQRLEARTKYDVEMLREIGYC